MKTKLLAMLLAVFLLTACAAPAPESESTPLPEPESVSEPEPEPKDVSHYFVEGDADGIEDQEAAENLYWYLKGNLTPKEYCYIHLSDRAKDPFSSDDTRLYFLYLQGMDRAPVEALLRDYDGPWAPIWYEETDRTLYDLMQAEEYVKPFLSRQMDFDVAVAVIQEGFVYVIVDEVTPELTAYLADFPIRCFIAVPSTGILYGRNANPD